MADRSLLHRNDLEKFHQYLIGKGYQQIVVTNKPDSFELIRWKGEPGKPMPIVFDRNKGDHLSLNDAAVPYVRAFIKQKDINIPSARGRMITHSDCPHCDWTNTNEGDITGTEIECSYCNQNYRVTQ